MTELPDRLLREALRPGPPPAASNACVDAEALAAWADGTMSGAARAAFETHAAGCARCQALMAAMARSEPPPIEPAWWRRGAFAWLMPLAAATAAIVIVVSVAITTQRRATAPAAREPSMATAPPRAGETVAAKEGDRHAAEMRNPAAATDVPQAKRKSVETTARADRRQDAPKDAAARAPKAESRPQDAVSTAVPQPVLPPPPSPPPAAAAPAAAAPAGVAPPAVKEIPAQAPASAAAGGVSAEARFNRKRGEGQLMTKAATSGPLLIESPSRDSQWRIVGGAVEHTDDAGATWQAQSLGVETPVRAGAAPAARVCWLVGARGLVLLTTDGAHWRRIGFPEPVDLVAIEAADASHATVTTAAGHRYSTADGGQTWSSRQ